MNLLSRGDSSFGGCIEVGMEWGRVRLLPGPEGELLPKLISRCKGDLRTEMGELVRVGGAEG